MDSQNLEKEDLLNLLLEKKIISATEDFKDLTRVQLEKLLNSGLDLIAKSLSTMEISNAAVEEVKESLLEDKDTFVKNISIENKRLNQKIIKLIEDSKTQIKVLAKVWDEEKPPRSKG